MAQNTTPTPSGAVEKHNSLYQGMAQDLTDVYQGEGVWTHARNAINTTHLGEQFVLSNEPGNELLGSAPYDIIGLIHESDTRWVVFSTNEILGEIGIFDERLHVYSKIIDSTELNFSKKYLIGGACKREFDTTYSVYWQDGHNPDRVLHLSDVPYRTTGRNLSPDPSCFIPEYTTQLDVDELLLHPKITVPRLNVQKHLGGGQLPAGSYQAYVAYAIKGIRVSNYFTPSLPCSMWGVGGQGGAIDVFLEDLDPEFSEIELVILSQLNGQTTARHIGYYSIRQTTITLDQIQQSSPIVDLALLHLQQPIYHKSDAMHELNGYLIRSGVSTRPDFNYQLLANQIQTNWVSVQYPAEYYAESGTNVGYLRDEVYCFFIRWVYNTGLKSASYHIPGRAPGVNEHMIVTGQNVLDGEQYYWEITDTATDVPASGTLPDGGIITARGAMQYWESQEKYPDAQPLVWGNLCGKKIRHHKFPSNERSFHFTDGGTAIVILGVEFTNIYRPVDENNVIIPDIVGYEILRGSREGNKSIVAKGIINNLCEYDIATTGTVQKGLIQNYPYNDLRPDKFLVDRKRVLPGSDNPDDNSVPLNRFQDNQFSFHSPDTLSDRPFLSGSYLQTYNILSGSVRGGYEYAFGHPKQKLITEDAFETAVLVGLGISLLDAIGPGQMETTLGWNFAVTAEATWARGGGSATAIPDTIANAILSPLTTITGLAMMIASGGYYAGAGVDKALQVMYSMCRGFRYVLQYNSHGFYNGRHPGLSVNRRRQIDPGNIRYIGSSVQDFTDTHRINNWSRTPFVALKTNQTLQRPAVSTGAVDNTRQRIQDKQLWNSPTDEFNTTTLTQYSALKVRSLRQYGQLDGVVQVPIHSGVYKTPGNTQYASPILFGGDTYITRYAEKNPYFFFNKWLGLNTPNDTAYDYREGINGPRPRYWANFEHFDMGDLNLHFDFAGYGENDGGIDGDDLEDMSDDEEVLDFTLFKILYTSSDSMHHLDRNGSNTGGKFVMSKAFMYLFCNGVRDFFVESEKNLAFRDHGNQEGQRHYSPYEPYTDLEQLFRADIIKETERMKYDNSLSVSKLYQNYVTWGTVLGRDFDPLTHATRFTYFPDRAIFSLQHQSGLRRDNWKTYLANNMKDFPYRITQIKALNATGALILFENGEPVQFVGVDQLKTEGGVKVTIGDGGLFQQGYQAVVNADDSLEYGSSQSKRGSINTPFGLYWISQKTAKIFHYAGGGQAQDISRSGMSRWFAQHLPSKLLHQFPQYPLFDNPVIGVGCSVIYDPTYELLYFSKRDFKLHDEFIPRVGMNALGKFFLDPTTTNVEIHLGNPLYFEDCSWTISFDPKGNGGKGAWLSFHDWIPAHTIPSYQHFVSVKGPSFYRHNQSTTSYCNYYGADFPFEVEVPVSTPGQITVIKSVEYWLRVFEYTNGGKNPFHVLGANFDRALLYNSEQNSGWLTLVKPNRTNPIQDLQYPKLVGTSLEVLSSCVENQYRFNQFWDQTDDRGQSSGLLRPMFLQAGNGYQITVNPNYFDFQKPQQERKRFRHFGNRLLLRRRVSGSQNMILQLTTVKLGGSAR